MPSPEGLIHLQLRRFAGCPICNLHLRSFVARREEIAAAGVTEVVAFHSTDKELLKYEADLPFLTVGDPSKKLYRDFGVEPSLKSVLNPRVWSTIPRAMAKAIWATIRHGQPLVPLAPKGGNFGLPGDFLIAPDGRVVAAKYGEHAYDQWSVDELLSLAAQSHAGT